MFGALKRGFRSMASLVLVVNVVGELRPKRTLAASRGFLAAARLSCFRDGNGIFEWNRSRTGQTYSTRTELNPISEASFTLVLAQE